MSDKKVNIKLEKYMWPDEIKQKREKRLHWIITSVIVVLALLIGTVFGSMMNSPQPIGSDGLSPFPSSNNNKFDEIFNILSHQWYFSKDMENPQEQMTDNAIFGMIEKNGDKHTEYMTPEEMEQFTQSINQNFVGIGIQYYQVEGTNIVLKVFNDSPAQKAGVQVGDIILRVDGTEVTGIETTKIAEMVKGEDKTTVTIDFKRQEEIITKEIVRGPIHSTTYSEMKGEGIGYLQISSFGESTGDDVKLELERLKQQGANKLIIDVRDNGGGYLSALNQIASFFLNKGDKIIGQEDVKGNIVYTSATGDKVEGFNQIVMLINENSASASEVLTLALRDNLNIEIIGTKSYGKGTVQTSVPLSDGSSLKYTIAQWISPKGNRINEKGIEPTIEVKIHEVFHVEIPEIGEDFSIKADGVHPIISYVQQALDFLGYSVDRFDGYYSPKTVEAYKKYLSDRNKPVTDVITTADISSLSAQVYTRYNTEKEVLDVQLQKAVEILK